MKANEILQEALSEMEDRADTYDKSGERSIPRTVDAFNAITSKGLTKEEGWLFMALLKAVRSQQGKLRMDSYVDGAAYFALQGEQAADDRHESTPSRPETVHTHFNPAWANGDFQHPLITWNVVEGWRVNGEPVGKNNPWTPFKYNGEWQRNPYFTGEPPSWDNACEDANYLIQDEAGEFAWFEAMPKQNLNEKCWDQLSSADGVIQEHSFGPPNEEWQRAIEKRPEEV